MKATFFASLLFFCLTTCSTPAAVDTMNDKPASQPESGPPQQLHDIWIASSIYGKVLDRKLPLPRLEVYVEEMRVTGNDGCNELTGTLTKLTGQKLTFGPLAGTKKMCPNMVVPDEFNRALALVQTYQLDGLNLHLMDGQGRRVMLLNKGD